MKKSLFAALLVSSAVHVFLLTFVVSSTGLPEGFFNQNGIPAALQVQLRHFPVLIEGAATPLVDKQIKEKVLSESAASTLNADDVSRAVVNYYPASALSQMPQPLTNLTEFFVGESGENTSGKVSIRLWLNRKGSLDRLSVLNSELSPPVEQKILAAFSQMRFLPGEFNGVAVMTWVDVVVEYGDLVRPAQPVLSSDMNDLNFD